MSEDSLLRTDFPDYPEAKASQSFHYFYNHLDIKPEGALDDVEISEDAKAIAASNLAIATAMENQNELLQKILEKLG